MMDTTSLQLTPAESQTLLKPNRDAEVKALKITLADLFLKRVFDITSREISRKTTYLLRPSEHFSSATLKPHEDMLRNAYWHCEEQGVQKDSETNGYPVSIIGGVVNLLGAVQRQGFTEKIRESLIHEGCLIEKRRFLPPPFNKTFQLTQKGAALKKQVKEMIHQGNQHLKTWLAYQQEEAYSFLQAYGANIFLLKRLDADALKKVAHFAISNERDDTMPPLAAASAFYDLAKLLSANVSGHHVLNAFDGSLGAAGGIAGTAGAGYAGGGGGGGGGGGC